MIPKKTKFYIECLLSLCTYVPLSHCPIDHWSLCPFVPLSLCPFVSLSFCPFVRHRFHCPICGLGRRTKGQVEQHVNINDKPEEDSQFNCKDCQFQTMNRDQLYQHIEMIHKKFECNLCNTFFNTRKDINVHKHETHRKIYKPCRDFPSKNCEYGRECSFYHVILNQGDYICFKCGDIFKKKSHLLDHIKSDHGQETCKRFQEDKCTFGDRCFTDTLKMEGM